MITVNGKKIDWQQGLTIQDIFKIMNYDYPLITVTVNGSSVHKDKYASTTVNDGDDVKIIHICHGG